MAVDPGYQPGFDATVLGGAEHQRGSEVSARYLFQQTTAVTRAQPLQVNMVPGRGSGGRKTNLRLHRPHNVR